MRPSIVPCQKVQGRRRYVLVFQEYPGGGKRVRMSGTEVHIPHKRLLTQLAHVLPTDAPPPFLKLDGTRGLEILALFARDTRHDSVELRHVFLRGGHGAVGAGLEQGRRNDLNLLDTSCL